MVGGSSGVGAGDLNCWFDSFALRLQGKIRSSSVAFEFGSTTSRGLGSGFFREVL